MPARDAAMDGVYACDPDTTAVDWLFRRGPPLVTVDQPSVPGVPAVNVDDRDGGRPAAAHVVALGQRRSAVVAFGNGPEGLAAHPDADSVAGRFIARERLAGCLDVLGPAGIRPVLHTQQRSPGPCLEAGCPGDVYLTTDKLRSGARSRPAADLCPSFGTPGERAAQTATWTAAFGSCRAGP